MQTLTDAELMEAYSSRQDEGAFGELMRRHGAMVYRACHRLLKDAHEAEDASQAVFVVLARKAGGLRKGDLAAWLYRVAHLVAAETVRKRMHRAKREESYAVDEAIQTDGFAASDVADPAPLGLVDAALLSLPERYREAVILRYLQNHSEAEAARRAGCAVGTLSMRASRGIAKLRQRLAKRGVALGGVALASLLTSEASAAIPETLLPSILATVKTAVATTATATAATTTAAMLAKGAMKAMFIAKVKMVAAVAAAVVVTGTAVPVGLAVAQAKQTLAWVENDKSNLRQLGAACLVYALDHNGQFPTDWTQLVPNYVDTSNLLVSTKNRQHAGSFTNVMQWTDYVYVKGHTVYSPLGAILAYLPPRFYPMNSEALVIFVDGSVAELTAEAFTNALQHPLAAELSTQMIKVDAKEAEDTAARVQLAIEDGLSGNYRLAIGVRPNGKTASLAEMTFSLKNLASGQELWDLRMPGGVLEMISAWATNGHRISATISFDDRLSLRLVRDVCRVVSGVETEKGMHVELPPTGQLYYRAFLPDESLRVRENRPAQPWELKLTKTGTTVSGTITRIEEVWRADSLKPNLVPTDFAVATPDAVLQVLREKGPGMPVILVFAPPELTYGELMRFVGPCVKTHGTIHVYLAAAFSSNEKDPTVLQALKDAEARMQQ